MALSGFTVPFDLDALLDNLLPQFSHSQAFFTFLVLLFQSYFSKNKFEATIWTYKNI